MLLKTKVLLIFMLAFFVFVSLNYGIHHYIILPGFKTLEISEATKDIERCFQAIQDEIDHVDNICHDRANRDDLYDFVLYPSADFVRKNLNMHTIVDSKLSFVCITDVSGKTVFCEAWDFLQKKRMVLAALPEEILPLVNVPLRPDKGPISDFSIKGVYKSDRGPMLISSHPILTSEKLGPARGTLILGRLFDATLIHLLMDRVELTFRIIDVKDDGASAVEREMIKEPEIGKVRIVESNERGNLLAYLCLPTIGGCKDFLIRAEIPRSILEKGRITFLYSFILMIILGLFIACLIIILLKKTVISPITVLSDHVLGVAKTGDLSARISFTSNDEIGILGREVNRMLEKIEVQTAELAGVNSAMKTDIEKRKFVEQELRESKERFRILHEASFGGIFIHDKGRIIDVNQGLSTITGYLSSELIGMDVLKLVASPWLEMVKTNIANNYQLSYDIEGVRQDGSVYPLEVQGRNMPYMGQIVRVTELRDVSVRKNMEQQLKIAIEELNAIIENSQVGIMALRGGRFLSKANQRLADILGYDSPEDMVGFSMKEFHLSEARFIEFGEKYFDRLVHGEQIQVEYELARRDGTPVWCTLSGKAVDSSDSPDLLKGVVWMIDDISEKRHNQAKLIQFATTDYLTGLCNRRHFMELAGAEFERQKRYPHCCLSLVMIDIDYFKNINDSYGHEAGDLVLKAFADIGNKNLRDVDILARIGGEEFAALLPATNIEGALAIAERFRKAIEKTAVITEKGEISFTVSLGITSWTSSIIYTVENMLKEADYALYAAKEKGRNRVEIYEREG